MSSSSSQNPPRPLESPESSSPIITRAVAAALRGEFNASYNLPGWQKLALRGLGSLPQSVGRYVIERFERISGLDPALLNGLSIERLAEERLGDYARLPGQFPCVVIGAALGGAAAHLADALGSPFLPQAFVTTLRGQVFFSPLSTFTITPDLVPWSDWQSALVGLDWINIGARPSHYPADTRAIVDWAAPLHRWVITSGVPIEGYLTAQELCSLSE